MGRKSDRRPRRVGVVATLVTAAVLAAGAATAYATYTTPSISWYTSNPGASSFTLPATAGAWSGFSALVNGEVDANGDGQVTSADVVSFAGKTVTMGGHVNLLGSTGNESKPIGTTAHPFEGTFDGAGKEVAGLAITSATGTSNAGLFGVTGPDSVIKNVILTDTCKVTIQSSSAFVENVGGLVGNCQGAIQNCSSAAAVNVVWDDGAAGGNRSAAVVINNVGGLAGICDKDLSGCSFSGAVKVSTPANAFLDSDGVSVNGVVKDIGGVVGRAGGTPDKAGLGTHGNISACNNTGTITVITSGAGGVDRFGEVVASASGYVGGVAGITIGNVSGCTNRGTILTTSVTDTSDIGSEAIRKAPGGGDGVGGIVGSLRGVTLSGLSTNGTDAGITGGGTDLLVLTGCYNYGYVSGLHAVGGICGAAGTYTTITRCVNGTTSDTTGLVGHVRTTRWNKPAGGGIAGQSYGTVSYSRNHGDSENTQTGFYTAGIVGMLLTYTENGTLKHPVPEVYACYNTGQVYCNAVSVTYKEGGIVGESNGRVHNCLLLVGTVSKASTRTDAFVGEDIGTLSECTVVYPTEAEAAANNNGVALTSSRATALLNAFAPVEQWASYYITAAGTNSGYPVLNGEATPTTTDLSTIPCTITFVSNAKYSVSYNPTPKLQVTATIGGHQVELIEGADYLVVGDAAALDGNGVCKGVTPGTTPYVASIKGMGAYSGQTGTVAYGIDKGDFSTCVVSVAHARYTGAAQNTPTVTVTDAGGGIVDPSAYTYLVNYGRECVNVSYDLKVPGTPATANNYPVVATAKANSNYTGSSIGYYVIDKIDLYLQCDVIGVTYNDRVWYWDENKSKFYEVKVKTDGSGNVIHDSETGYPEVYELADEADTTGNTLSAGRMLSVAEPLNVDADGKRVYGMELDYTGAEINPEVMGVKWGSRTLTGDDYKVVYGGGSSGDLSDAGAVANIEAKTTGAVTVRYGVGETWLTNYVLMTFAIKPVSATNGDGNLVVGQIRNEVPYNNGNLPTGITPKVTYRGNAVDAANYSTTFDHLSRGGVTIGSPSSYLAGDVLYYRVAPANGGSINFAPVTLSWTISSRSATNIGTGCTVTVGAVTYTPAGTPVPQVTVTDNTTHETLVKGVDYELSGLTVSANNKPGTGNLTVTGTGFYTGTSTAKPFTINKGSFAASDLETYADIKIGNGDYSDPYVAYVGKGFAYRVNGYSASDFASILTLAWKTDPDVHISGQAVNAYEKGCFSVTQILDASAQPVSKATEPGVYTLKLVRNPSATTTYLNSAADFSLDLQIEIRPATLDHKYYYYYDYNGLRTSTYTSNWRYYQWSSIAYAKSSYVYTGNPIIPSLAITDSGGTATFDPDDYTVTVKQSTPGEGGGVTNVGSAYTVTIAGRADKPHLRGTTATNASTFTGTFSITPANLSDGSVNVSVAEGFYSGGPVTPAVIFTDASTGATLNFKAGTDYTVSYSNNTGIGTGHATITPTGSNVTGSAVTRDFAITGATDISGATITAIPDQVYTGSAITPTLTVKDGATPLVLGTDYTVSYSGNVNVGTATATITGKGEYGGTKSATFKITAKAISSATIGAIPEQTRTGSAVTPTVTVTDGGKTLVKDTDYTVAYANNVEVGTATVTITGKGNYTGTKNATFTIVADTTAPVTTLSGITAGGSYQGSVTFTLSASDVGSGVAHTYYTLDSASQQTYSTGVTVSSVGSHTVTYWSADGAGNTETAKSVTFTVSPASSPMPIYRFYNVKNGSHFYTASTAERDMVIARWPNIYTFEGAAYSVNTANPANSSPLYRFYNKKNGSHFYTVSEQEKDIVRSKWPDVYEYEGPVYNVCATSVAGATPVYRFYNKKNGSHFYTVSEQEKDIVRSKWPDVYEYEGPAFWIAP
ncbi:MAG: OmpL47-type beta-barrel domain-containing protein [Coriobacteriia bacterium]